MFPNLALYLSCPSKLILARRESPCFVLSLLWGIPSLCLWLACGCARGCARGYARGCARGRASFCPAFLHRVSFAGGVSIILNLSFVVCG